MPTICALMRAATAVVAGDQAELQAMMLLTTTIGHTGALATSMGCRRSIDYDGPSHQLARLDSPALPSTASRKYSLDPPLRSQELGGGSVFLADRAPEMV